MPTNAIVRVLLGCLLTIFATACSSPEQEAHEHVARAVNFPLLMLKPAVAKLFALKSDDHVGIIEACMSADDQLDVLRRVRFDDEHIDQFDHTSRVSALPSYAEEMLLFERSSFCLERPLDSCSSWCLRTWGWLVDVVERIRQDARKHGVEIV